MTVQQLTLDHEAVRVDRKLLSPKQQWDLALQENPHLLPEIAATTRQLIDAGKTVRMNRVFEEMRDRVHTVGDEYRMNNTWRTPAAHHVMREYPDLDGVFKTRRSPRG